MDDECVEIMQECTSLVGTSYAPEISIDPNRFRSQLHEWIDVWMKEAARPKQVAEHE